MFDLFIPYLFALAIGLDPGADQSALATTAAPTAETPETGQTVVAEAPATPSTAGREPEPQIPTGQFTTAIEIKQILTMTKPQWIAIQDNGAQDLLYFTQLLSWRCGLWEIRYGLNGAPAETPWPLEPCHEGTASPNAITDPTGAFPIYTAEASGSIQSVTVMVVFDDGTTDEATYERTSVLLP